MPYLFSDVLNLVCIYLFIHYTRDLNFLIKKYFISYNWIILCEYVLPIYLYGFQKKMKKKDDREERCLRVIRDSQHILACEKNVIHAINDYDQYGISRS